MQKFFLKKIYLHKFFFMFKKYFIVKFTMAGISNQNVLNFIEEKSNKDIKKKFCCCVFLEFYNKIF